MKATSDPRIRDLIEVIRCRTEADVDIRPATVRARIGSIKRVLKTWPGIGDMRPCEVTPDGVHQWAARFKVEGSRFRPPGSKRPRFGASASSVNSAIDALRQLMDLAVELGHIGANPVTARRGVAGGRLKKRVARKPLLLPSRSQFEALFAAMENNGSVGGGGAEAADLCRFLLMSGARVGEAALACWRHVLWDRRLVHLPGFKSDSSSRFVPLFPELEALLRRIQARRASAARFRADGRALVSGEDPIFRIRECQKTIDAAHRKAGVPRVTHHDFRHAFATTCIESGVDIPTVASWLGHGDGGVLAMRTYGHFRPDHGIAAARKVRFGAFSDLSP